MGLNGKPTVNLGIIVMQVLSLFRTAEVLPSRISSTRYVFPEVVDVILVNLQRLRENAVPRCDVLKGTFNLVSELSDGVKLIYVDAIVYQDSGTRQTDEYTFHIMTN